MSIAFRSLGKTPSFPRLLNNQSPLPPISNNKSFLTKKDTPHYIKSYPIHKNQLILNFHIFFRNLHPITAILIVSYFISHRVYNFINILLWLVKNPDEFVLFLYGQNLTIFLLRSLRSTSVMLEKFCNNIVFTQSLVKGVIEANLV
jgi:hypothetical protein